jgi:CDP-4-dehydro-6-deoxyglucose reductase/ferredoxin-NAD(P)+ reductase (naphthalene dioxygenase ferredoxin-specific)
VVAHRVRIEQFDREISVEGDATILSSALDAGIDYPFMCQQGQCGSCKSLLLKGEVELGHVYNPMVLPPEDRARGYILACQARPLNDCTVSIGEIGGLVSHPVRTVDCVVRARAHAGCDTFVIRLEAVGGPVIFSAGQYAALRFGDLPPRDFSMANRPDDPMLEFHIQNLPGGLASGHVASRLKVGDPVELRGPYGAAYLREEHLGPILLAAGGTGLAPLLSIVKTALRMGLRQRFHLYVGARRAADLYCQDRLAALAARHRNLHIVTALSNSEGDTPFRRGHVADVVAADFTDATAFHAYIAGPPAHCEATRKILLARGLPEIACYTDPFVTAGER